MARSISPVVPGLEPYEIRFGAGQPEYNELPALRGGAPLYNVLSRWKLTDEERAQIASGSDIYLSQLTFGRPYQPSSIQVASAEASAAVKDDLIEQFGLNDELDERLRKL